MLLLPSFSNSSPTHLAHCLLTHPQEPANGRQRHFEAWHVDVLIDLANFSLSLAAKQRTLCSPISDSFSHLSSMLLRASRILPRDRQKGFPGMAVWFSHARVSATPRSVADFPSRHVDTEAQIAPNTPDQTCTGFIIPGTTSPPIRGAGTRSHRLCW